ncbi:conserved hypothetical protein [Vibrio crassostreae]|uniref:hypothetical protein n=1 Tax=Vibrio crassostreae TaxID=246167 RepID=UPI001B3103CD|nr:hypothetical protein [Vibrio crassostreae]CAK1877042.1 conserved hypothetical protein [Vibrio crassostreae]CAK2061308.1 conserved hypothetical protein [Vibrio crassostreae]CAK2084605.1 conserved hypothetical protein [Vibrio crassostreae]CAK2335090.1 conserved hypothetical protein [Vibrio crassostreae]CAK2801211.1 conserved hypothetical protein [Vibrio crassostreae]
MIKLLLEAFRSKGYEGYKSTEAQKKFADSLLKIADKLFWAPIAYLGVLIYQNKVFDVSSALYITTFLVLAVCLRHQALKVYDLHEEKSKAKAEKARLTNKK